MSLEPIVHVYALRCSPESDAYVNRVGEWWHPNYSANSQTLRAVTIEPGVGGRVYATHQDMGDTDWGRVTVWEPGRRLVHTFTLAQAADQPSEIIVLFASSADGCTVRFEHGGWTQGNVSDRRKFSEWPVMLDRFASLANNTEAAPG